MQMQFPPSDARKKQEKCLNSSLLKFIAWAFAEDNVIVEACCLGIFSLYRPKKNIYFTYKIFYALLIRNLKVLKNQ